MPAQESAVSYINALVKMAKEDGVLDDKGRESKRERRPSRKARKEKGKTPALNVETDEQP